MSISIDSKSISSRKLVDSSRLESSHSFPALCMSALTTRRRNKIYEERLVILNKDVQISVEIEMSGMDKLLYYRELEREQQALEKSIQRRNTRIEELVQDIASLKEILDMYRTSKEWLDSGQGTEEKFDPEVEAKKLLSGNDTSDVIQALKLKKSNLTASTASLLMELRK